MRNGLLVLIACFLLINPIAHAEVKSPEQVNEFNYKVLSPEKKLYLAMQSLFAMMEAYEQVFPERDDDLGININCEECGNTTPILIQMQAHFYNVILSEYSEFADALKQITEKERQNLPREVQAAVNILLKFKENGTIYETGNRVQYNLNIVSLSILKKQLGIINNYLVKKDANSVNKENIVEQAILVRNLARILQLKIPQLNGIEIRARTDEESQKLAYGQAIYYWKYLNNLLIPLTTELLLYKNEVVVSRKEAKQYSRLPKLMGSYIGTVKRLSNNLLRLNNKSLPNNLEKLRKILEANMSFHHKLHEVSSHFIGQIDTEILKAIKQACEQNLSTEEETTSPESDYFPLLEFQVSTN